MADYYTELSVEIFQKDVDFPLDDLYAILTAMDENDFNKLPEVYKNTFPENFDDDDYFEGMLGIKVINNPDSLWLYSDGSPNIELIVNVVQAVMREHKSKCSVGFEWGYTCSKPRTDGFGGGAVFITMDSQDWLSTQGWLAGKRQDFPKTKDHGEK